MDGNVIILQNCNDKVNIIDDYKDLFGALELKTIVDIAFLVVNDRWVCTCSSLRECTLGYEPYP